MLLATKVNISKAAEHLSVYDPNLRPIIKQTELPTLEPHTDYYGALVNSIIGQQLSVKAASSIKRRFRELFDGMLPTPVQILEKSEEDLRAVGFSRAKAAYVRDLAQHIIDNKVDFSKLNTLSNQEIITELTDVKGIGEWTVHMFLIFCMGRLDVLPTGDLGIKNGVRALYNFKDAPTPDQIREVAQQYHWDPYESAASWYVWRSLDSDFKTI